MSARQIKKLRQEARRAGQSYSVNTVVPAFVQYVNRLSWQRRWQVAWRVLCGRFTWL